MLYPFLSIVLGCEDSFDKVKDKSGPIAACQSGCEFQKSESTKSEKISNNEKAKEEDKEKNVVVPFLTIQVSPKKLIEVLSFSCLVTKYPFFLFNKVNDKMCNKCKW